MLVAREVSDPTCAECGYLKSLPHKYYYGKRAAISMYSRDKKERIIENIFFSIACLTHLLGFIWLYCWCVLINDHLDIEEFLYAELKFWFQWFMLIFIFSILTNFYILTVVSSGLVLIKDEIPLRMCILHKLAVLFCAIVTIAEFCVLGLAWPGGEQWRSVLASFDMTSPFLQLTALIESVLFFNFIISCTHNMRNVYARKAIVFAFLCVILFLITLPFWLYSPCIGKDSTDLRKPLIIGHRGAPSLAPENTALSFRMAIEHDVYALETDVRISADGVPFLMHDDTLLRTTNVADIFSERMNDRAESFTWSELSRLSAGEWYLRLNPFSNRDFFNDSYAAEVKAQKIPSLLEFARFASTHNKSIVFDLSRPPRGHQNRNNYMRAAIDALLDSHIRQERVIANLRSYRFLAPGFRLMSHHVIENPALYGIDVFNLPYSVATEEIIALNVSVIEYVIDVSWTFSRAWCQGAWAVTTNYSPLLAAMEEPSWVMTKATYFAVWTAVDLFAIITVALFWYYCNKKLQVEHVQQLSKVFDEDM